MKKDYFESDCFKPVPQDQLPVIPYYEYENFVNGSIYDIDKKIHKNKVYKKTFYEEYLNVLDDEDISYIINENGHRCDTFKNSHDGIHILFSGCSYTFGESLPYKKNWAGYVYNEINKINKVSGYYNLSYPGGGIDVIINNIYKYCNIYGKPSIILLLLPQSSRKNIWHNGKYYSVICADENKIYDMYSGEENAAYYLYNIINNFEIFCKINNIFLRWATWYDKDIEMYKNFNFQNYINISRNDVEKLATNYTESLDKYFMFGRDKAHPGLAYSSGLSNVFLKELYENNII